MALAMMHFLIYVHSTFLLIIIHNKTEVQSYVKDVVGKMIEFLYFCRFLQLIESKTNIETDSKILKLKNVTKTNMRLFRYCAYKVFTSSSGKSYWAAEVSAYVKGSTITYKSFYLQDIQFFSSKLFNNKRAFEMLHSRLEVVGVHLEFSIGKIK